MHDFKFQAYLKYSHYISLLLYYLCLNTDVSIMLFLFIKPEPYYNFSLVGMKKLNLKKKKHNKKRNQKQNPKKPKQAPNKQQKCPRTLKLNFQVSLLVFLARRKEAEISSEICTVK